MSYVVVIRDKAAGTSRVHEVKDLRSCLKKLLKYYKPQGGDRGKWHTENSEANKYIAEHYNADQSASQIAAHLSHLTGMSVTKNMVIKRAQYLGLGKGKPL